MRRPSNPVFWPFSFRAYSSPISDYTTFETTFSGLGDSEIYSLPTRTLSHLSLAYRRFLHIPLLTVLNAISRSWFIFLKLSPFFLRQVCFASIGARHLFPSFRWKSLWPSNCDDPRSNPHKAPPSTFNIDTWILFQLKTIVAGRIT